MQLSITQSQAIIIKNSLNMMQKYIKELYNTELLSSSKELGEIDNLFDKLSVLSDTSRADDFYKQTNQSSSYSYNLDKRIYNAGDIKTKRIKHGKDLDIL